jgi:phage repressor protein C with HTH and peptisase S24 domain
MITVDIKCDARPMADMGDRLREARIAAGFRSARSAALKFGWNPSTYAAHENGQNGYDPGTAERYARAFKVRSAWLLTADGPRERAPRRPASEDPEGILTIWESMAPAERQRALRVLKALREEEGTS